MARLQILELPSGADDDRPPFALVVDQCQGVPLDMVEAVETSWRRVGEEIGARGTLVLLEAVTIPANEPTPTGGDPELIHAHEQTRLALCDALLLSRDTTWHQLTEQAAARQRELASLYRQLDAARARPAVDIQVKAPDPVAAAESVHRATAKEPGGATR
ncbi:hypothetical protein OG481_02285 [Streptomyces longwoodensis]|uniref:hypothetical protein n=1 Tax=Streptomyces longwoodensis TaxID=68231 RepID=UPI002DDC55EE|nr:hypothetical protein [Streptomyces longwoodensis]WRY87422.1 hypothetical protein OG481_02285 [Streptomyces longwoodensis]